MKTLHSWFSRPMRRAPRRALVVASVLSMVFAVAVSVISQPLFLILLVLSTLMGLRFSLATRRLTERSSSNLDEREIELRNHVYFRAYKMIMLVGVVLAAALIAVWSLRVMLPELGEPGRVPSFMLIFYVWLVMYLPSALLAWQLPDPPADEALHFGT